MAKEQLKPGGKTHFLAEIQDAVGCEVTLTGWLQAREEDADEIHLSLRDTSGIATLICHKENIARLGFVPVTILTKESFIRIKGSIQSISNGSFRISISQLEICSQAQEGFATDVSLYLAFPPETLEKQLANQMFNIRSPKVANMLRVRAEIFRAIREFFYSRGIIEFHSPTIAVATDPGVRTAHLFGIAMQEKISPYILSTSAQLYKQAVLTTLEQAYCICPALRFEGDTSLRTGRHLREFWELDVELSLANYFEVMDLAEALLEWVFTHVQKYCKKELDFFGVTMAFPARPYRRIQHHEAVKQAKKLGIETEEGQEISWEAERAISADSDKPFWIYDYPITSRAWYYRQDPSRPSIVKSMDLMYAGGYGEGITGGEREFEYEQLLRRISGQGDDPCKYKWYTEMFKFGMPPSAGFGLGIERLVRYILKLDYIWEAVMFPRVPGIVSP